MPWSSGAHPTPRYTGIVGSVVEFSPATRETGVRFPDNAGFSNYLKISELGRGLTPEL